mmetsp:Transcript_16407/g.42994  ORF Transcript_16407/g.42994 Transcript_16407/m.42994 type:complete len:464 (+) Transcript_16407:123-1514(+)
MFGRKKSNAAASAADRNASAPLMPKLDEEGNDASQSPPGQRNSVRRLMREFVRILRRDDDFHQSSGQWTIRHTNGDLLGARVSVDWFHSALEIDTRILMIVMVICYLVPVFGFAWFWVWISDVAPHCIDPPAYFYIDGLYMSIQTFFTIGFDVNNIYFGGCATPSIVLLAEMMLGVMLNAMVVGIIFARFSRANERHRSILFSKHAILKRVDGRLYFMFQAFEMRTQQALIEAHVRCYAIRHEHRDLGVNRKERPGMTRRESFIRGTSAVDKFTKFFRPYPMRLQHPDDELGAMLLLTVPNVVVHRLDAWSPLVPTTLLEHCNQIGKVKEDDASSAYRFPDVQQRQCDVESKNRESDAPEAAIALDELLGKAGSQWDGRAIIEFLAETEMEIVVMLEGIEPIGSCTIQARHSYTYDQIMFNHDFKDPVSRDPDGRCVVDIEAMNQTVPLEGAFQMPDDGHASQ